jgi:hypothetical protein
MADVRRLESTSADPTGRDGEIDALLVDGLDRYFTGRYEEAIHLWTRVLFLDRSHARARAYIDRARSALSERQRRSEELLEASRDQLERGDAPAARQLLAQAVESGGEDEHAAALRVRLERVERATAARAPQPALAPAEVVPGWRWRRKPMTLVALPVFAALAVVLLMTTGTLSELLGFTRGPARSIVGPAPEPLPSLTGAEVALVRARTLYQRGRLAAALVELDRVSLDSPQRQQADQLRIDIQQLLLASARDRFRGTPAGEVTRR